MEEFSGQILLENIQFWKEIGGEDIKELVQI